MLNTFKLLEVTAEESHDDDAWPSSPARETRGSVGGARVGDRRNPSFLLSADRPCMLCSQKPTQNNKLKQKKIHAKSLPSEIEEDATSGVCA